MSLFCQLFALFVFFRGFLAQETSSSWRQILDGLHVNDPHLTGYIENVYGQTKPPSALTRASVACRLSEAVLKSGDYIGPASYDYVNRTRVNWSDTCWQNASCFIMPQDAGEVSLLTKVINLTQTRFSVRSGGHDFNMNHSSVDASGLVIDMRFFNQVSLAKDKKTAVVGPGNHWGDVYRALNGTGVSINGGRSPNVGVGGQTLGGGVGWLSSIVGVTAASVAAVDVVLTNGTLVHANETSNSDLLWAVRGGGPNFGIITAYTFKTVPIDKLWYESRLYTADQNQELINALYEYQKLADGDSNANIVYALSESKAGPASFVGFTYLKLEERPPVFKPFLDIPPAVIRVNSTFGTLADLAFEYFNPQYPEIPPERNYVVSLPIKVNNATYQAAYRKFKQLEAQAAAVGGVFNFGSQPMAIKAVDASQNTPLGLSRSVQDWIHVTMAWSNHSADALLYDITHEMGKAIDSSSKANKADVRYRFMNDAYDGQNVLNSYGDSNLQTLRKVAQKYDPSGVLQRLQNGGWLLSKAT